MISRRRAGTHAGDAAVFLDEIRDFRLHPQMEGGILCSFASDEVEEVPLRHQRDERAAGPQMGEIGDADALAAEDAGEVPRLLVWQLEKFVQQAELADHVERRRMNGVAAEIAQKVLVLLQHDDIDAGPRQQEP